MIVSLFFMACPPTTSTQGNLDLTWEEGIGLISPTPVDTIDLEEQLNVNDTVFVLPTNRLDTITWEMENLGPANVSSVHNIRFLLIRQLFLANLGTGQIGYQDRDTIIDELGPGPNPLSAGSSAPVVFAIDTNLDCGLYKAVGIVDGDGNFAADTNFVNDTVVDWVFVQSTQRFNLTRTTPGRVIQHLESGGPAQPSHTFGITSGSPTAPQAIYTFFKVNPPGNSVITSAPIPPVTLNLPAGIATTVDPDVTLNDVIETKIVKVTVVSTDGCILKQRAGITEILHDE